MVLLLDEPLFFFYAVLLWILTIVGTYKGLKYFPGYLARSSDYLKEVMLGTPTMVVVCVAGPIVGLWILSGYLFDYAGGPLVLDIAIGIGVSIILTQAVGFFIADPEQIYEIVRVLIESSEDVQQKTELLVKECLRDPKCGYSRHTMDCLRTISKKNDAIGPIVLEVLRQNEIY